MAAMDRQALGERLRRARGSVSQRKLAPKIGVTNAHVSSVESGSEAPSLALLERWAEATDHDLLIALLPRNKSDIAAGEAAAEAVRNLDARRRKLAMLLLRVLPGLDDTELAVIEAQLTVYARRQ